MEYVKPAGRTQKDLDTAAAAAAKEKTETEAREYLTKTDYLVVKQAEAFLLQQGLIDIKVVESRETARAILSTGDVSDTK